MEHGKLNLVVGAVGILFASLGGMALGMFYPDRFAEGPYAIGHAAALIRGGHTHGQPLAMYNLIFAALIGKVVLPDRSRRIASRAAALGMFMPIGLALRGMADASMIFAPVTMIGAIGFMVSAGFLLAGSRGLVDKSA